MIVYGFPMALKNSCKKNATDAFILHFYVAHDFPQRIIFNLAKAIGSYICKSTL